jgi:hypothetical protein
MYGSKCQNEEYNFVQNDDYILSKCRIYQYGETWENEDMFLHVTEGSCPLCLLHADVFPPTFDELNIPDLWRQSAKGCDWRNHWTFANRRWRSNCTGRPFVHTWIFNHSFVSVRDMAPSNGPHAMSAATGSRRQLASFASLSVLIVLIQPLFYQLRCYSTSFLMSQM